MKLYHASNVSNIETLIPHVSNHGKPLTYFSSKRENTLVYLSNAVEKFCKENGFENNGKWYKWASYGFTKDGILRLEEYYKNATELTYKGADGYIYEVESDDNISPLEGIPYAYVTDKEVKVVSSEYIPDALEELKLCEKEGKIVITKYSDNTPKMLDWIKKTITKDYENGADKPDYRFFLENRFGFLKEK